MRSRVFFADVVATAACLIVPLSLIAADELPKDGAWARYYVVTKTDGEERSWKRTIRFVGTVTENGEKHRWVEFADLSTQQSESAKPRHIRDVHKLLIPEKALRESTNPIRHAVRGWSLYGSSGQGPAKIAELERRRQVFDWSYGPPLTFLPASRKRATSTKNSKTIDYQKGQLKISNGAKGRHTAIYRATTAPVVYTWKTDYERWRHKSIPLGTAALKLTTSFYRKSGKEKPVLVRKYAEEYVIEAWGTDAKSALPKAE